MQLGSLLFEVDGYVREGKVSSFQSIIQEHPILLLAGDNVSNPLLHLCRSGKMRMLKIAIQRLREVGLFQHLTFFLTDMETATPTGKRNKLRELLEEESVRLPTPNLSVRRSPLREMPARRKISIEEFPIDALPVDALRKSKAVKSFASNREDPQRNISPLKSLPVVNQSPFRRLELLEGAEINLRNLAKRSVSPTRKPLNLALGKL